MIYRVIQWYTGAIAREQIRTIQRHPDYRLVGAVVHHEAKAGKDVADIVGGEATGVTTLRDADEALGIEADVVLYNAPFERYDEIVRILASGKNVITPSGAVYPRIRPEFQELEAACASGGTTLLGTGANPGFAGDLLPLVASSLCTQVRSVRVQEIGDIGAWDPFMLTDVMRFGWEVAALEKDADYFDFMTNAFQQSCRLVAEALSFDVEAVTTTPSFARAKRDLLGGRVKAGTVGGIRLEVSVIAGGRPVVVEDLMWRLDDDLDPAWPVDPAAGEWQLEIDGDPSVKIGTSLSSRPGEPSAGVLATAARMVNSIADVCNAPPGIMTAATAPMPRCRNAAAGE